MTRDLELAKDLHCETAEIEHARGGEQAAVPDLDGQVDDIDVDVPWLIF